MPIIQMRACDYRQVARERLSGNWGVAVLTSFVASLLGAASTNGYSSYFNLGFDSGLKSSDFDISGSYNDFSLRDLAEFLQSHPSLAAIITIWFAVSAICALASFILGGATKAGLCEFNKGLYGGNPNFNDLFKHYSIFGKAFLANLLVGIFTTLWTMLFIIPGFPFITSGIDLAKLDLRSGLERLAYAIIIVMVATMFAWIMALLLQLKPMDFEDLDLGPVLHLILRLIMSFFGVFGFSIMFNSPAPMAATAALIGAIANSLRLELVDLTGMPAPAAAFAGALTAGLLASFIKENNGYPRISLTVPSIVIMVPGLYLYRAIYNFGIMALSDAVSWFASAIMIIIALPLGLIFARILTDKTFRYCT